MNKSLQETIFPEGNRSSIVGFTQEKLFALIFDNDIIQLLVEETNKYAHQKNNMSFYVTKEEMLVFLPILIVSGYNSQPSKQNYWANGDDLRNFAIYNAMRRNKFEDIMSNLHFNLNDNLDQRFSTFFPLRNPQNISHVSRNPCAKK